MHTIDFIEFLKKIAIPEEKIAEFRRDHSTALNENGDTALHIVIQKKRLDFVSWLLNLGVDPNRQNHQGLTPLHFISNYRDYRIANHIANLLFTQKASPTILNLNGYSPVHVAAFRNNDILLENLIRHGGYKVLDTPAFDGEETPLLLAIQWNRKEAIRFLWKQSILTTENKYGKNAITLLIEHYKELSTDFVIDLLESTSIRELLLPDSRGKTAADYVLTTEPLLINALDKKLACDLGDDIPVCLDVPLHKRKKIDEACERVASTKPVCDAIAGIKQENPLFYPPAKIDTSLPALTDGKTTDRAWAAPATIATTVLFTALAFICCPSQPQRREPMVEHGRKTLRLNKF